MKTFRIATAAVAFIAGIAAFAFGDMTAWATLMISTAILIPA